MRAGIPARRTETLARAFPRDTRGRGLAEFPAAEPAEQVVRKRRMPARSAAPANPKPTGGRAAPSAKAMPNRPRTMDSARPAISPRTAVQAPCLPPERPAALAAT